MRYRRKKVQLMYPPAMEQKMVELPIYIYIYIYTCIMIQGKVHLMICFGVSPKMTLLS